MKAMKKALALLLTGALAVSMLGGCGSKEYPSKNINVTIQYSAGGPTDMSVRALLDAAGKNLPGGVSFVPANRTGSGGIVGMTETANAKADGYNIGVIAVDLLMHKYLGRTELGLDDYIPLATAQADPYGLVVSAKAEYQTLDEFVEYAKAHPGEVVVGNTSAGGAPHLAALAFEEYFGVEFKHVSYDGSAECITAIVSGEINATFTQPSPAKAQLDAGECIMLGVLDEQRLSAFPDVPTILETYDMDFVMRGWVVVVAPKGMEGSQVTYLKNLFEDAVNNDADFKAAIENLGMQYCSILGDDLTSMLEADDAFYQEICAGLDVE